MRIDLHIHSTASDGTCTPEQILKTASELELGAIAITDHDTVKGVGDALQAGIPDGLKFVTGVEISAAPPPSLSLSGSLHILGYDFDVTHGELNRSLGILQNARKNRNPKIIERLNHMGFEITLDDVRCEAEPCQLGRPHIARAMVRKKMAGSINEAFDRYLGKGQPAYVDKYRMPHDEAIAAIRAAGGVAVLAHPVLLNLPDAAATEALVRELHALGLQGLEVYYPQHSPAQTACYRDLARRLGLLMTGGSDFHGAINPDIQIGVGKGDFYVPYELYEALVGR